MFLFFYSSSELSSFMYMLFQIVYFGANFFMFLFTGYALFFIIIPIMKDNCAAPVDVGQTLSEYQAKLISKSMNESESNVNNYSL